MADNEQEDTPKKPPKINMGETNGNGLPQPKLPSEGIQESATAGTPGDDTTRIDLGDESAGKPSGLKPAKASLHPKEDTTRIDLPSVPKPMAQPPGKSQTARLDLSAAKPPKKAVQDEDTARTNLKSASSKKPDTARIDLSQASATTQPVDAPSASDTQPVQPAVSSPGADTAKIDLGTATPPQGEDTEPLPPSEAPTRGIAQLTEEEREEILKQSTMRAELDAGEEAPASDFSPATSGLPVEDEVDPDREEILKQETTSVELEDGIQPEEQAPSAAQNKTMRVEVDEEVAKAKSQTARIELPPDAAENASARISIKESDASEDVFKRHAAAAATASIAATSAPEKSETASTDVDVPSSPTPAPDAEVGKSKTARIEMPAEATNAPAGRPKTIKIKRAEAAPPMRATAAPKAGVKRSKRPSSAVDSEVGTLYGILTIASVIVIGVLLYVLAAQTVAPTLPFMGKIG